MCDGLSSFTLIISKCLKSYDCYVCVGVCRCLEFDEQPPVEYSKQLVLSCVLHCCQKLSHEGASVDAVVKQALNVESVVQCIRASQNPHTHHHALLLLAHIAGIMPVSLCLSGGISSRILSYTVPCPLYRVIKKSLCTWWLQYRKLQVMFKGSSASLQTFINRARGTLDSH